jgi:tetratricopeptide (TPR) repeat protein
MLGLKARSLRGWEKQGLIPVSESYGFHDLLALRTLVRLRSARVPPIRIRQALGALRGLLSDGVNPLAEVRIYSDGPRIHVQLGGRTMEPVSGQLILDFAGEEIRELVSLPRETESARRSKERERRQQADQWFQKGVELEQSGAPAQEAVAAYERSIALDPKMSAALVNLGTIHFTAREWESAENCYRLALDANPDYPLAHFNLGNLYDERGDSQLALLHYLAAIRLDPHYADAHYNIALLYQAGGQWMKAVRHWKHYLRIDPASQWGEIARRELAKIYQATVLPGRNKGQARR